MAAALGTDGSCRVLTVLRFLIMSQLSKHDIRNSVKPHKYALGPAPRPGHLGMSLVLRRSPARALPLSLGSPSRPLPHHPADHTGVFLAALFTHSFIPFFSLRNKKHFLHILRQN